MNCTCGKRDVPVSHFLVGRAGETEEREGHELENEEGGLEKPLPMPQEIVQRVSFAFGFVEQGCRSALTQLEGLSFTKMFAAGASDSEAGETEEDLREACEKAEWRLEEARRILRHTVKQGDEYFVLGKG